MIRFVRCWKEVSRMKSNNDKAIHYAEEHGVVDYVVHGNKMVYYANYPAYLSEGRRTYKIVVNLDTMKEESRTQLKRWNRNGNYNMYK